MRIYSLAVLDIGDLIRWDGRVSYARVRETNLDVGKQIGIEAKDDLGDTYRLLQNPYTNSRITVAGLGAFEYIECDC